MGEIVKLPKFGLTMEEASISEWSVEEGESISKGQVLAIIESEKVEMELPSPASGIVAKHLVAKGATVAVGEDVAIIAADQAELSNLSDDCGGTMPVVTVQMWEGRTPEQKRRLMQALTQAMVEHAGARPEALHIVLHEIPKENWGSVSTLGQAGRT